MAVDIRGRALVEGDRVYLGIGYGVPRCAHAQATVLEVKPNGSVVYQSDQEASNPRTIPAKHVSTLVTLMAKRGEV